METGEKDIRPLPGASSWLQPDGATLSAPAAAATGAADLSQDAILGIVPSKPASPLGERALNPAIHHEEAIKLYLEMQLIFWNRF